MLILLVILILVLAGILPGVYRSLKHILGWKALQGNAQRYLEQREIVIFLLRTGLFMFFFFFILSSSALTIGFGVLFAFLNILLLKRLKRRQRGMKNYRRVLLSGFMAGSIIGGIWIGIIWLFIGVSFTSMTVLGLLVSVLNGGFKGGLVNGVTMLICFMGGRLNQLMFRLIAPLFILPRFAPIICNQCYRVTFPLKCRYELGQRFCEHCQQAVEDTKMFGKVVFTFDDVPLSHEGRVFVLSNPDFEYKKHHVEVSEVYLDPQTTDKRLLERFITYIVNYPPRRGLKPVTIFYRGELKDLGVPLANALRNTFTHIAKIH